eukprot:g11648.t1
MCTKNISLTRSVCSKADFFHFAGVVAIAEASEEAERKGKGKRLEVPFLWGRSDCQHQGESFDPVSGFAARLPKQDMFWDELLQNMGDKMGFVPDEIVAISGAHTLGQMGQHSQLLHGSWDANNAIWDNDYYKHLQTRNWLPRTPSALRGQRRVQWGGHFDQVTKLYCEPELVNESMEIKSDQAALEAEGVAIEGDCVFSTMLRTDIELAFDSKPKDCVLSRDGYRSRMYQCKEQLTTYNLVRLFAHSLDAWQSAFSAAMAKLQAFGGERLEKPGRS